MILYQYKIMVIATETRLSAEPIYCGEFWFDLRSRTVINEISRGWYKRDTRCIANVIVSVSSTEGLHATEGARAVAYYALSVAFVRRDRRKRGDVPVGSSVYLRSVDRCVHLRSAVAPLSLSASLPVAFAPLWQIATTRVSIAPLVFHFHYFLAARNSSRDVKYPTGGSLNPCTRKIGSHDTDASIQIKFLIALTF